MSKYKLLSDRVRDQGEADQRAGKPISAYYDMPLERHTELLRGAYEMGWRYARDAKRAADRESDV